MLSQQSACYKQPVGRKDMRWLTVHQHLAIAVGLGSTVYCRSNVVATSSRVHSSVRTQHGEGQHWLAQEAPSKEWRATEICLK